MRRRRIGEDPRGEQNGNKIQNRIQSKSNINVNGNGNGNRNKNKNRELK